MTFLRFAALLALFALFAAACGGPPDDARAPDAAAPDAAAMRMDLDVDPALVLAEDRNGPVTWADVDAFVLALGPARRWPADGDPRAWFGELARRVALERLLADEAVLVGADQEAAFLGRARQIQRVAYSEAHLAEQPPLAPPSDDDLRARYDQQRERFERPERRRVANIFKRFVDGDREAARAALERVRQQVIDGASFEQLARTTSDSETRHRGGDLGFVVPGQHTAELDDLLFGLEAGVPSRVVLTRDGAHLFYVSIVLEARALRFDDARPLLLQEWRASAHLERLRAAADSLDEADAAVTAPPDAIQDALRQGRRDAVVFALGDFQLTAGQLMEQIEQLARQLGRRDPGLAARVLDELRSREILYQHLRDQPSFAPPTDEIEQVRRRQLVDHYASIKLEAWLDRRPERVQMHYDANTMRFAAPPRLQLTRFAVPFTDADGAARMAQLEAAVPALDAGAQTLENLAASLDGAAAVATLPALTPRQLAMRDPGAVRFATLLQPGEHSPPYRTGEQLAVLRLDAREEPAPLPLARVRDAVVEDLIAQQSTALFAELADTLLAEADFRLREENLAQLTP
ncbi:MAG: peptidyl-prolyl cis-trans isomerase [Acidobacteriota bacterium]